MIVSILLAKFLGVYLVLLGILLIFRQKNIIEIVNDTMKSSSLLFMSAILTLLLGILLILLHNLWVADWRVLVTILAWMIFIKGIIRLYFPEFVRSKIKKIKGKKIIFITGWVSLVLGLFLVYHGFVFFY